MNFPRVLKMPYFDPEKIGESDSEVGPIEASRYENRVAFCEALEGAWRKEALFCGIPWSRIRIAQVFLAGDPSKV